MKVLLAVLVIVLTALANFSQEPSQKPAVSQQRSMNPEVDRELTQTANLYRSGNFAEAQQHAERAVSLEPANVTAAIFLARVRHQRYKPGNDDPQNLEMARAAIEAYQTVLTLDSQSEEAYKAIAVLYASTHQEELLRAWIMQRAMSPQVSNQKRAEAYAVLAGKDWDCSYKFTELPDHKITEYDGKKVAITYKLGNDVGEFEKIKQCVTSGLEMADAALLLDYDNEPAWAYKTNLFLEAAKLAEMEGLDLAKADYQKQANEAQTQAGRISEQHRRAGQSGYSSIEILPRELPPPPTAAPSPSPRKPLGK